METVKNIPVSQVVTFLAALAPSAAAVFGAFDGLPYQVQIAFAVSIPVSIAYIIGTWLKGRAQFVATTKALEANND